MSSLHAPSTAVNLSDVLRGVMRRKLFIMGTTALALAGSLAFVTLVKPVYTTEAQVLVENLATPYDQAAGPDQPRTAEPIDNRAVLSQVSVMKSRDLASRVVDLLKLEDRENFGAGSPKIGIVQFALLTLGFGEDPRLMSPEERAIKQYYRGLTVYQLPESAVIALQFEGRDAATSAEIVNTLASQYVAETAEARVRPTARAREWLAQQIAELKQKVAKSEAAVEVFRSKAGLLRAETSTLNTQELSELNRQITAAETARTDAEQRAKSIKDLLDANGSVDDSVDVLNSPTIQNLRGQQVSAARKVAELSATYLSNHPKMIAARNELANVERQLRREALKIVQSLAEQAQVAKARQAALVKKLDQLKGLATSGNQDEVKLKAMERDAAADRSLLESLLLRYADASARQDVGSQPGFARIIQQASVPSIPSFPKKGPTVLLISLAGLLLSLGLAFLLEIMAAASRAYESELEEYEEVPHHSPALPMPPIAKRTEPVVAREEQQAEQAEAELAARVAAITGDAQYKAPAVNVNVEQGVANVAATTQNIATPAPVSSLRQNTPLALFSLASSIPSNISLLQSAASDRAAPLNLATAPVVQWMTKTASTEKIKRFAIVSVGIGNTVGSAATVAIGRAAASQGLKVMMLDLSSGEAGVHMLAGLAPGPGLADLLAGKADFTSIVVRDSASPAHIVRFGLDRSAKAVTLLTGKLDQILTTLNGIYDLVIVNAGELSSSAQILAGKVQAALLIAPAVRQREVAAAVQALKGSGMNAVEFVALVQGMDEAGASVRAAG